MDDSHFSDAELIRRFLDGDREAFNALVRRYEKKVYQYAYRLTQSQEDAADVASETFVRLYTSVKSFRGEASLSTWLYRVVSNVYFDYRKRQKSHQHQSLEGVSPDNTGIERQWVDTAAVDLEERALRQERRRALELAVSKLPEYQRAMVVMFHMEERSYEEIAEIMEMPLGTVKSRLNRARIALKDLLKPYLELFDVDDSQTNLEADNARDM